MGVQTEALERLAYCPPAEIEIDGEWVPVSSLSSGEVLWVVLRWDERSDPGPLLRQLVRLLFYLSERATVPQRWEFIGTFPNREDADAACLDESYCLFPATLGYSLPPGPVRIEGYCFPRRSLHNLLQRSPPAVERRVSVPVSWVRTILDELKRLEGRA